jgi:phage shock protein A
MLDKAEDPEKLIKLMIREMEDTLVELKASCAGVMAGSKKLERNIDEVKGRVDYWAEKAPLAVSKGRDDLAREALIQKRKYAERVTDLEEELKEHEALIDEYQNDIRQLEDKLAAAREKQRMLVQRHIHATRKRRAQEEIRRAESSDAIYRFDDLENRIERMEAEADLVNYGKKGTLEAEFEQLGMDDEIEKELNALKNADKPKEDNE